MALGARAARRANKPNPLPFGVFTQQCAAQRETAIMGYW
jgi:hypothetical protein